MRRRVATVLLSAGMLVCAGIANHAAAITINRVFISAGNPIPNTGINATGAPATVGGGNLVSVVNAAADWWEAALLDNDHTLTINFGWGNPSNANFIAQHTLVTQAGAPNRETEGSLRFRSDGSVNWYLDPSPRYHTEWLGWDTGTTNLGGGALNNNRRATNPTGNAVGNTDVFSTALHEIGHALGLSTTNTAYQNESWPDNFVNVTAPRPLPGTNIPTNNSAVPTVNTTTSNAHVPAGTLPNAVMQPGIGGGVRRLLTHVDILANAEISQFTNINLNPFVPVLTVSDLDFGNVRVGAAGMATLTATNTGDVFSTLTANFPDLFTVFQPQSELAFSIIDGDNDTRDYTYTPVSRSNNDGMAFMDSIVGTVTVDIFAQGVGPVFTAEVVDDNGSSGDVTPLPNGVNSLTPEFVTDIDFGEAKPNVSETAQLNIENSTSDGDLGPLTDLTIAGFTIVGPDADLFALLEDDGTTPFVGPQTIAAGDTLPLLVEFPAFPGEMFGEYFATLTLFTDQGAVLGGNGVDFVFDLTGVLVPEPSSWLFWITLAVVGLGFAAKPCKGRHRERPARESKHKCRSIIPAILGTRRRLKTLSAPPKSL